MSRSTLGARRRTRNRGTHTHWPRRPLDLCDRLWYDRWMAAPVELVGRDEELRAIRAFVESDEPVALVLEGEAGIGKTTLWRRALDAAAERDATVLVARPSAAETGLAFSCLSDMLT